MLRLYRRLTYFPWSIRMDANIILGIIILCLAYGFILYLIIWSRKTIEMIEKGNLSSLREILEELRHGKSAQ